MRRVALYGYLGNGNIGNDASFETVIGWLRSNHPEIEIRCITIAPEVISAKYGVPSMPLAWRFRRLNHGRFVSALGKLVGRILDVPRSFALAGPVDAIIVPGMGVLEDNLGTRFWGLPSWLFFMALACRLRRRYFLLLDVGANWAASMVTRRLCVATVAMASHVSYRDDASAAAMARAGARRPDAVAPDLAFAHPITNGIDPEPGRIVIGVMAYYGHGNDPIRGADVCNQYVASMAEAAVELIDSGNRLVLVGGDRVDVDIAWQLSAAVHTARPSLSDEAILVRECTTFAELSAEMSRAQVVVASRFHNLICGLRLGRPTISAGYASKCAQLMQTLGLDDYSQDIGHLNAGQLATQVRMAQNNEKELSAHIQRGVSRYAHQVEALLDQVAHEDLGLSERGRRDSDLQGDTPARRAT